MAAAALTGGTEVAESSLVSQQDIQELKEDLQRYFKSAMTELIQPVQTKLEELTEGLGQAFKTEESALETAIEVQQEMRQVHSAEKSLQAKILSLEGKWRQSNLKLRGIEEGAEVDLVSKEQLRKELR
ncbi:UNVERIFIED_CONTAM: hypothetical protein K2H54_006312 [Gekko kuhli]